MKFNRFFLKSAVAIAVIAACFLALHNHAKSDDRATAPAATPGSSREAPSPGGSPQRIVIVSSLPRTGNAKQQTGSIVNGIRMALEEVNSRVGDFQIEYRDEDDATASAGNWTAEQESSNAINAAGDPDVMVYIGTYNSGAAKNSMPILNRAGLVMISPANTAVGLTKPNPDDPDEPGIYRPSGKLNYVRVCPTDDVQGPLGAEWAKQMGVKRVFVLDDHEVYGRGLALLFAEHCEKIGIEVVGQDSVDSRSLEFRPLMTSIKALNPDLIYFGGTTQSKGGQIAKDIVAVGLNAKLMVPDGCMEQAFIESAGARNLNDRCFVTFGGIPAEAFENATPDFIQRNKAAKDFVEAYQKRFHRLPEAYAIYGYEAGKVALDAIRRAGKKDRSAIREAALNTKDFHGALGTWSFDKNGDTTQKKMSGIVVHDGKFEFKKLLGG